MNTRKILNNTDSSEQTTGLLPKDYAKYDNLKRIVYEIFVTQHIPYKRHKSRQNNHLRRLCFLDSIHASTSDFLYRTKCPNLAYIGPLLFMRYSIIVETAIPRYSLSSLVLNSLSCIVCSFVYTFSYLQTMRKSHFRNITKYHGLSMFINVCNQLSRTTEKNVKIFLPLFYFVMQVLCKTKNAPKGRFFWDIQFLFTKCLESP